MTRGIVANDLAGPPIRETVTSAGRIRIGESQDMAGQSIVIKGSIAEAIREGRFFSTKIVRKQLPIDLEILIRNPPGSTPSLSLGVSCSGSSAEIFVFEGPTIAAAGSPLERVNYNRIGTPRTAKLLVFEAPTVTADGFLLGEDLIPDGSGRGPPNLDAESRTPLILNPDTDYLLRFSPETPNIEAQVAITWTE